MRASDMNRNGNNKSALHALSQTPGSELPTTRACGTPFVPLHVFVLLHASKLRFTHIKPLALKSDLVANWNSGSDPAHWKAQALFAHFVCS